MSASSSRGLSSGGASLFQSLESRRLLDGLQIETELVETSTGEQAIEVTVTLADTTVVGPTSEAVVDLTASGNAVAEIGAEAIPDSITIPSGQTSATILIGLPGRAAALPHILILTAEQANQSTTTTTSFGNDDTPPPATPPLGSPGTLSPVHENRRDMTKWPLSDEYWAPGMIVNNSTRWLWVLISNNAAADQTTVNGNPSNRWYPLAPGASTPANVDIDAVTPIDPTLAQPPSGTDVSVVDIPGGVMDGNVITVTDTPTGITTDGNATVVDARVKTGGHPNAHPPGYRPPGGWPGFPPDYVPIYERIAIDPVIP